MRIHLKQRPAIVTGLRCTSRRKLLRHVALPAVAAASLAASGCGGTTVTPSGGGAPANGSDAKAEYLQHGNAILCAKSDQVMRAVAAQVLSGEEPTEGEEAALALPAMRKAYVQLAGLPVPSAERAEVSEMLGALRRAIDTAAADPAVLSGDGDPFVPVERRMSDFGLDGCD